MSELLASLLSRKIIVISPKSASGVPILVMTSAKKKSLNLTFPNGAIKVWSKLFISSILAVL